MSNLNELESVGSLSGKSQGKNLFAPQEMITDRYQIEEMIGRGGFGEVYRSMDLVLKRQVAIKILYRKSSTSDAAHERNQSRFLNEARITAQLKHPALPVTYDFGTLPEGELFLVYELLHGIPLTQLIKQRKLTPKEAMSMLEDVAGAIQAAHERGILHQDLKPSNIFCVMGDQGENISYKVLDFGIAKQADESDLSGINIDATKVGGVVGSLRYLSPERFQPHANYGPPSDLYSLGIVFFVALTQRLPYRGNSMFDIGLKHLTSPIPQIEVKGIQPRQRDLLQGLINDLLAKSEYDRIQTALELGQRVKAIREQWEDFDPDNLPIIDIEEICSDSADRLPVLPAIAPAVEDSPPICHTEEETYAVSSPLSRSPLIMFMVMLTCGSLLWWRLTQDDRPAPLLTTVAESSPDTNGSQSRQNEQTQPDLNDKAVQPGLPPPEILPPPRTRPAPAKKRKVSKARSTPPQRSSASPQKTKSQRALDLQLSLSPFKAAYLTTDHIKLNVRLIGGAASQLNCKLTPSSVGSVKGRKLKLKSFGRARVTCCAGDLCKTRKILVLDKLLDDF